MRNKSLLDPALFSSNNEIMITFDRTIFKIIGSDESILYETIKNFIIDNDKHFIYICNILCLNNNSIKNYLLSRLSQSQIDNMAIKSLQYIFKDESIQSLSEFKRHNYSDKMPDYESMHSEIDYIQNKLSRVLLDFFMKYCIGKMAIYILLRQFKGKNVTDISVYVKDYIGFICNLNVIFGHYILIQPTYQIELKDIKETIDNIDNIINATKIFNHYDILYSNNMFSNSVLFNNIITSNGLFIIKCNVNDNNTTKSLLISVSAYDSYYNTNKIIISIIDEIHPFTLYNLPSHQFNNILYKRIVNKYNILNWSTSSKDITCMSHTGDSSLRFIQSTINDLITYKFIQKDEGLKTFIDNEILSHLKDDNISSLDIVDFTVKENYISADSDVVSIVSDDEYYYRINIDVKMRNNVKMNIVFDSIFSKKDYILFRDLDTFGYNVHLSSDKALFIMSSIVNYIYEHRGEIHQIIEDYKKDVLALIDEHPKIYYNGNIYDFFTELQYYYDNELNTKSILKTEVEDIILDSHVKSY